jgi:signal transduction histidine kinase
MIFIFIALIAAVSITYFITSQYIFGGTLTVCYAAAVSAVCVVYFAFERSKRQKMISRIIDIFDGKFSGVTDENELSALERRVVLSAKNKTANEAKITDSYKNIAALVSDISHQCKTPLSSVLMYAEMPPDAENSAAIRAQAEKLSFLLDALTKLSRCEGGLISENLRPVEGPVEALICNSVNAGITSAEAKNIGITSEVPDGLTARFDMRWTTEVIFNLIDNAVKYSPPDSVISISAREYEMFVRIDIADRGIGIPESEQNDIWKRFYRGKNVVDSVGGVGIGLYLTRSILNSEDGRISVASEEGHGSTFSVYLPRIVTKL